MRNWHFIILLAFTALLSACQKYYPKPRGYYRIGLPEKTYQKVEPNFLVDFEYPKYCQIKSIASQQIKGDIWFDMVFSQFNARLHLSYMKVNNNFQDLSEDSRNFVYKHTVKADAINETVFHDSLRQLHGIIYELEGNTASSIQFIATDSTSQFLRGALYFNNHPNVDSMAPVLNFIKKDIYHLIETLNWKE